MDCVGTDQDLRTALARLRQHPLVALARQFTTYVTIGFGALAVHYGLLVLLVELGRVDPVPAAILGYVAGGFVSYTLNRRHTYASDRPHGEALWRFVVVAGCGLVLTWVLMALLIRWAGLTYLPAQVVTTGLVVFWNFSGNKLWTFAAREGLVRA
ncbi:GtrA family protein [Methylobacterium sp. CB376]|uniref:GtrA family protein n=1 Tax=unclassified Methylobacterium TaxID=2615210 RepID=UPI000152E87E|nr:MULTISPECIES: GtrA family protein [Methylobacterium]WFT83455.1 GtrA family protein [Methylobacterium nodulans]